MTSCFPGRAGPRTEAPLPLSPVGIAPTSARVRHGLFSYVPLLACKVTERREAVNYNSARRFKGIVTNRSQTVTTNKDGINSADSLRTSLRARVAPAPSKGVGAHVP